jgi:hypothetical protein
LVSWSRLVHKLLPLLPLHWHWFGMHILFACIILQNAADQNSFQLFRNSGLCQIFLFMTWSAAYFHFRQFNEFSVSFVHVLRQNSAFHPFSEFTSSPRI